MNNKSKKDQQNQSNGKEKLNRELESKKIDKLCNDDQFWKVTDEVQPTPVEAFEKLILKYTELPNPQNEVSNAKVALLEYWDVTLLYGSYNQDPSKVYALKLESKIGENSRIYVMCKKLKDKKTANSLLGEMDSKGYVTDSSILELVNISNSLKKSNNYTRVDNLELFINGEAGLEQQKAHDYLKYYRTIFDHINENLSVFPNRFSSRCTTEMSKNLEAVNIPNHFNDKSHGVKLNTSSDLEKYGDKTYAVLPSVLARQWKVDNTQTRKTIMEGLIKMGVVYGSDGRKDRDITVIPGETKKCYIFILNKSIYEGGTDNEK